ncbi:MAG TPA: type I-U CRISPR-associated RAMP protein Csb1/Cas7u [Micropepsaceae bacterium]|nr:type I-U CRISPR-associated RAMP protein Csb1/Cas7u [Micropepsaceae bacterium]
MTALTTESINDWADNKNGPVALTCTQKLLPVEGEGGVIFPPTYADIGYNIDALSDGTRVATIDSVGSQANRMEPIFTCDPYAALVPQITIDLRKEDKDGGVYVERRSIFDLAHRSADAVVYSCPKLAPIITKAYLMLRRHGDAGPLCSLAPTSLLFGVWDSRGGSGEKRPRLIRSIIRAWDVEPLYAAAQFNSIWKALSEEQQAELQKEAKTKKTRLSEKGFADAPATFRKVSQAAAKQMPEFRNGTPNSDRRVLGGVVTKKDSIRRDITVNLVALRNIHGATEERSQAIRRYLLGLALVAATADIELFLREGCNLRFADTEDHWTAVPRRGEPMAVELSSARELLLDYAKSASVPFKKEWPTDLSYTFDLKEAKKLLAKKEEDEEE